MIIKKFGIEAGGIKFMTYFSFRTILLNNFRFKVRSKKFNVKYSNDFDGIKITLNPNFPVLINSSF